MLLGLGIGAGAGALAGIASIKAPTNNAFTNTLPGQAGESGGLVSQAISSNNAIIANATKPYTSGNFRNNLAKLTGEMPANSHAHHVFPQAESFSSFFNSLKININEPRFGAWWNSTSHLRNAWGYNAQWKQWIGYNPNAQYIDVLNYGRQIMQQYGLPVHF